MSSIYDNIHYLEENDHSEDNFRDSKEFEYNRAKINELQNQLLEELKSIKDKVKFFFEDVTQNVYRLDFKQALNKSYKRVEKEVRSIIAHTPLFEDLQPDSSFNWNKSACNICYEIAKSILKINLTGIGKESKTFIKLQELDDNDLREVGAHLGEFYSYRNQDAHEDTENDKKKSKPIKPFQLRNQIRKLFPKIISTLFAKLNNGRS